jgi:phosphatidylinositol glycan class M
LSSNSGSTKTAKLCAAFWLFNPLPAAVSSRGNAESLMSCLVLMCVQLLIKQQIILASLVYGTAVHFKIYPVTYALPVYLLLGNGYKKGKAQYPINFKQCIHHAILPTKERAVFVICSLTIFVLLTGGYYYL